jgi:hypothetical protein
MEKQKKGNTGFLTGLFCAIGGIAAGVAGKMIYDELSKDQKAEEQNKVKALYKQDKVKNIDKDDKLDTNIETENEAEYESFFCPICLELMKDPVITPQGISFERKAILDWLKKNSNCPITKAPLREVDLITNYALKCTIEDYLRKQKCPTKIG